VCGFARGAMRKSPAGVDVFPGGTVGRNFASQDCQSSRIPSNVRFCSAFFGERAQWILRNQHGQRIAE
jgi:hypothetical protein